MTDLTFAQLPFLSKFASLLSLFLGWVALAELVIDRHGLDRYLPYYRVGNFCPYDVLVILMLVGLWWRLHRGG